MEISKLDYSLLGFLGIGLCNQTPGQDAARTKNADGFDHTNIKHIRTRKKKNEKQKNTKS